MSTPAVPSFDEFVKSQPKGSVPHFDDFVKQNTAPVPGMEKLGGQAPGVAAVPKPEELKTDEEAGNPFWTSPRGLIRSGLRRMGEAVPALASGEKARAANAVIEGGMQALTPAAIPFAAANPFSTAAALGAGYLGKHGGEAAADLFGAAPDTKELVGNVSSLAAGGAGGKIVSGMHLPASIAPLSRIRASAPDVRNGLGKIALAAGMNDMAPPGPIGHVVRAASLIPSWSGVRQIRAGLKAGSSDTLFNEALKEIPKGEAPSADSELDAIARAGVMGQKFRSFAEAPPSAQATIKAIVNRGNEPNPAPATNAAPVEWRTNAEMDRSAPQSRLPAPPSRQLTAPPLVTPPPADPSGVTVTTGQPLSTPTRSPAAPSRQLAAPALVTPPPADPSRVTVTTGAPSAPPRIPPSRQLAAPPLVTPPPADPSRVTVTTGPPLVPQSAAPSRVDQLLQTVRGKLVDQGALPAERNLGELPHGNYVDRYDVGSGAPLMRGPQTRLLTSEETTALKTPAQIKAAEALKKAMQNK